MAAVTNKGTCHVYDMIKPTPSAPIPPLNPTGGGDTSPSVIRAPSTTQFLSPGTTIPAHSRYALKCKFSPDSTLLATAGADQTARVWRLNGPEIEQIQELKVAGGQRWVWDLAFSADAQYLLTASSDGVARLWGVADGKVKREYLGHQKALTCLAFRDGQA